MDNVLSTHDVYCYHLDGCTKPIFLFDKVGAHMIPFFVSSEKYIKRNLVRERIYCPTEIYLETCKRGNSFILKHIIIQPHFLITIVKKNNSFDSL